MDQVQGCSKPVTFEDPLIIDIIMSREATSSVFVGDVIILEKEQLPSASVGTDHVQPVQVDYDLTTKLAVKQIED